MSTTIQQAKERFQIFNTKVHVLSHGKKWAVIKSKAKRAIKLYEFREQAYFHAKQISDFVVVHAKDGTVLFTEMPKVNSDNKLINEPDIHFKPFELVTLSNNVKVGLQFQYSYNSDLRYPLSSKERVDNVYLTFNRGNSCVFLIAFFGVMRGVFKENKMGRISNLNEGLEKINKTIISQILSSDTLKDIVIRQYGSEANYMNESDRSGLTKSMDDFKTPYWIKLEKMFQEYKEILINQKIK